MVILAAVGILDRQIRTPSAEIPLSVSILTWTLLGVSITFFISRLIIVSYRHRNQRSSTISRRSPSKNHGNGPPTSNLTQLKAKPWLYSPTSSVIKRFRFNALRVDKTCLLHHLIFRNWIDLDCLVIAGWCKQTSVVSFVWYIFKSRKQHNDCITNIKHRFLLIPIIFTLLTPTWLFLN